MLISISQLQWVLLSERDTVEVGPTSVRVVLINYILRVVSLA